MKIKVKKLSESASLPARGSVYAAGYDLRADIPGELTILPQENALIPTGLSMEIPEGYFGGIFARSGLASKESLRPANCVGVIDSDYRGPVMVSLHNDITDRDQTIFFTNPFTVTAVKCDTAHLEDKLEGCEFTLFNSNGDVALDLEGNECIKETNEEGVAEFTVPYNTEGYYLQETRAPEGYQIEPEPRPIDQQTDLEIVVTNSKIVKTADMTHIWVWTVSAGMSLLAMLVALIRKKVKK